MHGSGIGEPDAAYRADLHTMHLYRRPIGEPAPISLVGSGKITRHKPKRTAPAPQRAAELGGARPDEADAHSYLETASCVDTS